MYEGVWIRHILFNGPAQSIERHDTEFILRTTVGATLEEELNKLRYVFGK